MIFLWIFTIFWCGVSFTMLWITIASPTPWYAVAFVSLFALIGTGLLVALLTSHYQRWRTGRTTLSASPARLMGGETTTLTFQLASDKFAGRTVNFKVDLDESDDGWSTRQTLTQTGLLHAALRQATARITLPVSARASSNSWRWQASAHVDGLKYSTAECGLEVLRTAEASGPSKDTVALDAIDAFSMAPTRAEQVEAAPANAREISPGSWQWYESSTGLRVLGGIMIAFALFWLRNTGDFGLIRTLASGREFSWGSLGVALFSLPFIAGGVVLMASGIAMLTLRMRGTARRGELVIDARFLFWGWHIARIQASEIHRFQAASSMSSGPTVLRYALAARTARGALTLPITAKSVDGSDPKDGPGLISRARWLAGVLGIPGIGFDPETMASDEPLLHNQSMEDRRNSLGRAVGRLVGGAFALGLIGFALLFVWSLWSSRH